MTETKQLHIHTKKNVLNNIDKWYINEGVKKIKELCFDIKSKIDLDKFAVIESLERILNTDLQCDLLISDELLEKIKLYII